MRVLSTRRLGLALLGVAAIALSPSAFAQDPLAPADGQEAVADPAPAPADAPDQTPAPAPVDGPAPAEEQPPADAAAPAPAPEQPAEDPAAAAPAPAPEQPAEEPAPAPAPAEDPAPAPEQPVEEPAPAPAPAEEPAAPAPAPAEEPAADPAPAPAPEQPAEEPAPAPAPAPEPPAEEPAAAPPADDQAPPPGDAAAEPPAEESAAAAAPPTDEPAPPEPPPPPATTDAEDPGATPAITPTTGQAGWGWEAQCIGQYLQCGGLNYWGPTNCCEGHQCEFVNDYWWQCNPIPGWVPPAQPAATPAAAPAEPTPAPTRKPHHWGHHHHPTGVPTLAPTFPPTDGGPPFWEQECFRVRKNILNLTPEELADFIEGLQVLKANGVYDNITAIHGDPKTFGLFHGNDYFLPWHRWYVLKIESAVRALGGKWACFAMPYWDWTLDAGREMESPIWNIFGPMGKKNDSFCMREGPWAEWKNNKGGCLKRIGSDSYRFFSPAEVMDLILNKAKLVNGFRPAFEAGAHSRPHLFIGGAMNSFASPDDPIFWLHHAMVDKVWAMWQDCHALFDPLNIAPEMFKPEEIDAELAYAPGVTTRSMWSIKDLGYTYETDIMSAYTFLEVCHWFHLKPNPGIDLNLPSPPLPELSPESRFGPVPSTDGVPHPPPAVTPAIADGADTAIPPDEDTEKGDEGADKGTGTIEGIMEEQQASTPKLRGHKPKPKPKPKSKGHGNHTSSSMSGSKPSIATTRASAFFPGSEQQQLPQEATKEWAIAQAAVAPFAPHGKGLIVEENRIFVNCMKRVAAAGPEEGLTKADCMKAMLRRDCEMLGYICDLPENYKEGMFATEAEEIFKKGNICTRACHASTAKEAWGMGMHA